MALRIPVVVLGLLALAPVPVARASHIEGRRWPGGRITYWNGSRANRVAVRRAAAAWNASGIRVRFVAAPRRRARVWITQEPGFCHGFAQIGYAPGIRHAGVTLSRQTCGEEQAVLAAHELGHILGLGHEDRRCALMNSAVQARCARPPEPWRWRCRIIEGDDLRAALRLYGGRARPLRRRFCDRWPAPGAPSRAAFAIEGGQPVLRWTNPASRHLESVRIDVWGDCRNRRGRSLFSDVVDVRPGRRVRRVLDVQHVGPVCLVVQSQDLYLRGRAVTLTATLPNRPPVAAFTTSVLGRADVQFEDGSSDDEDAIVSRRWTFGDGSPASGDQYPAHRYASGGTFSVTLTVRDKRGATGSVTHPVTVAGALTPVADFDVTPSGLSVSTAGKQLDPRADGGWESFTWNWGDGSQPDAQWDTAYHDYASPGTYVVRLTAVNSDGGSTAVSHSVTVTAP